MKLLPWVSFHHDLRLMVLVDANGNAMPPSEGPTGSGDDAAELAKQLQNRVASLISVSFQNNFEFNIGPNDDGFRYTLNFQPVIPISLGEEYNLIVRTIVRRCCFFRELMSKAAGISRRPSRCNDHATFETP